MNLAQHTLLSGAIKSGVSAATGLIIALPIVDPMQFSLASVGGWRHILSVIGIVVVVAEARFFKAWADSGDEPTGMQASLAAAASANVKAGDKIFEAQETEAKK